MSAKTFGEILAKDLKAEWSPSRLAKLKERRDVTLVAQITGDTPRNEDMDANEVGLANHMEHFLACLALVPQIFPASSAHAFRNSPFLQLLA